jgi:hypothetical protein
MFFTAVKAAARVDSGRFGGFPSCWTAVIVCFLQLFKLLPEWILDDFGRFPAVWTPVIICVLQLFKLLPEWILDDLAEFLLFGLR